jgi:hypothetical protein
MNAISKIIYAIIVCKFLMGIRERLMSKTHVDPTKCLLIEYFPSTGPALLFGYADSPGTLQQLVFDMREHGFKTVADGQMAVVNPIGNNMFKFVFSDERIGPYRLCSTTRGRWYDIAKKFGMKAEVIDHMCGMN